jgi:hypothetical protein
MEAKLKAQELVDKFNVVGLQQRAEAYQCAVIAVDEIINVIIGSYDYELEKIYWQDVKNEIEKL